MLEQHAVVDVATPIYYFSGQIVLIGETRGTLACKERKKKRRKKEESDEEKQEAAFERAKNARQNGNREPRQRDNERQEVAGEAGGTNPG